MVGQMSTRISSITMVGDNHLLPILVEPHLKHTFHTTIVKQTMCFIHMIFPQWDIQIAFLINGIHALINAIKSGKVYGIPVAVPTRGGAVPLPAQGQRTTSELGAPVPALAEALSGEKKSKKTFFGKGAHKKTHDEIMEEKRKKEAMFRKYLK